MSMYIQALWFLVAILGARGPGDSKDEQTRQFWLVKLQFCCFYSDSAQVHQEILTLAAYSVTKSWYFCCLIHNITVSYCPVFIFPIHFSHFQSILICDPGNLATIIGIFLGPKGNKFLILHTSLISEKQQVTWLILFLIFPPPLSFSYGLFLLIFYFLFNLHSLSPRIWRISCTYISKKNWTTLWK